MHQRSEVSIAHSASYFVPAHTLIFLRRLFPDYISGRQGCDQSGREVPQGPVHEWVEQCAAAGDIAVELWAGESRAQIDEERLGEVLGVARGVD